MMTPRGAHDSQRSDSEPQDEKKSEPRRFQDRPGPPPRSQTLVWCSPWGIILAFQTAPKQSRKRSKIKTKMQTMIMWSFQDLAEIFALAKDGMQLQGGKLSSESQMVCGKLMYKLQQLFFRDSSSMFSPQTICR